MHDCALVVITLTTQLADARLYYHHQLCRCICSCFLLPSHLSAMIADVRLSVTNVGLLQLHKLRTESLLQVCS